MAGAQLKEAGQASAITVLRQQASLLATALAGGLALTLLHVPAGWMSGGMIATAGLAAAGRAHPLNPVLRQFALAGAGLMIGSGVTPDMLESVSRYPASLTLMMLSLVAVTGASAWFLHRRQSWSAATSLFASVPGALTYVFALAPTTDADLPRVAIVQLFRVFTLMALVPLLVGWSATLPPASQAPVDGPTLIAAMMAIGVVTGLLFERLGVAGGMLFGPMLLSAALHGAGIAPGRLPDWMTTASQILIGAWTGARFAGFDWRLLGRTLSATAGSLTLSLALSAIFAGAASLLLAIPFADALVAFAPGGLEAMTVLAFALGLDPLYVGSHHLARFLAISVGLPFVLRWLQRRAN